MHFETTTYNTNDRLNNYITKHNREKRKYNANIEKRNKIMSSTCKIGGVIAGIISAIIYTLAPSVFKAPAILMEIILGIDVLIFGFWRTYDLRNEIEKNKKNISIYATKIKKLEGTSKTKTQNINNTQISAPKFTYNPNSAHSYPPRDSQQINSGKNFQYRRYR